jgi:phage terminase large subunit-like protein
LAGRGKKNWKTGDLVVGGLYRFTVWPSAGGNDSAIIASDEDQAADDLALVKLLVAANPVLAAALEVRVKEVIRRDTGARLRILPAQDASGLHGKTYNFLGIDEMHTMRDYAVLEALAQDPTRHDALTWMTSYASIYHRKGVPLYDYMALGKAGTDPRFFFSWYAADYTTDPAFAGEHLTGEQRANPSMASWGNDGYLAQQKTRLPSPQYRRLHLNLPGAPEGAAFDPDAVMAAIVTGRKRLPYDERFTYIAGVDMSGGSSDNACLAIVHLDPETGRVVLDCLINQGAAPPFNSRDAVARFAIVMKDEYHCFTAHGDAYGGNTFRSDFQARGINYQMIMQPKHSLFQALEAPLLAGELEWLDAPILAEEALGLVYRSGGKIDHLPNAHDDHINAVAVATFVARQRDTSADEIIPIFVADEVSHGRFDRWAPNYSGGVPMPMPGSGYDYAKDEYIGTLAWDREQRAKRGNS